MDPANPRWPADRPKPAPDETAHDWHPAGSAYSDAARPEAAYSDAARPEAAYSDAARPEAAHSEAAHTDAAYSDAGRAAAVPRSSADDLWSPPWLRPRNDGTPAPPGAEPGLNRGRHSAPATVAPWIAAEGSPGGVPAGEPQVGYRSELPSDARGEPHGEHREEPNGAPPLPRRVPASGRAPDEPSTWEPTPEGPRTEPPTWEPTPEGPRTEPPTWGPAPEGPRTEPPTWEPTPEGPRTEPPTWGPAPEGPRTEPPTWGPAPEGPRTEPPTWEPTPEGPRTEPPTWGPAPEGPRTEPPTWPPTPAAGAQPHTPERTPAGQPMPGELPAEPPLPQRMPAEPPPEPLPLAPLPPPLLSAPPPTASLPPTAATDSPADPGPYATNFDRPEPPATSGPLPVTGPHDTASDAEPVARTDTAPLHDAGIAGPGPDPSAGADAMPEITGPPDYIFGPPDGAEAPGSEMPHSGAPDEETPTVKLANPAGTHIAGGEQPGAWPVDGPQYTPPWDGAPAHPGTGSFATDGPEHESVPAEPPAQPTPGSATGRPDSPGFSAAPSSEGMPGFTAPATAQPGALDFTQVPPTAAAHHGLAPAPPPAADTYGFAPGLPAPPDAIGFAPGAPAQRDTGGFATLPPATPATPGFTFGPLAPPDASGPSAGLPGAMTQPFQVPGMPTGPGAAVQLGAAPPVPGGWPPAQAPGVSAGFPGQPTAGLGGKPPGAPRRSRRGKFLAIAAGITALAVAAAAGGLLYKNAADQHKTTHRTTPPPSPTTSAKPTPSLASKIDSSATDPRPITEAEIFPGATAFVEGHQFVRVAAAVNRNCAQAARGSFAHALAVDLCQRVVRATFVDSTKRFVVTAGVAALPTNALAKRANRAKKLNHNVWFVGLNGPAGSGAELIAKTGGYAYGVVDGRYIIFAYATYTGGHTPTGKAASDPVVASLSHAFAMLAQRPITARANGTGP